MANDRKPDRVHARSRDEWRDWLERNGSTETSVLVQIFRKDSGVPSISYEEAVLDALCFGWVDAKALPSNGDSFHLTFVARKPTSTWSKPNRERAERLIAAGLMRPAGQAVIDSAKESGVWDSLAEAQDGVVSDDLAARLASNETALANFERFPPSSQRLILAWIASAKKPETRERRIDQTVEMAHRNERANHPRR